MQWLDVIAGMGCAFIITLCVLSVFAQLSPKWRLIDKPGGHRHHAKATPTVGGIGIFFGLCAGLAIALPMALFPWPVLLATALVLVTGTLDDMLDLPASCRFLSQALAAVIIVGWAGAQLSSLGELLGRDHTVLLNSWSWPMSIFAIIGLINAFNMSDGVDGQCGALSVVTLASLIAVAMFAADYSWLPLLGISLASVCGFLVTNMQTPWRSRASVFLGDAGSTSLGLLLGFCLIKMSQGPHPLLQPVTALWLVAVPLIDTITVMGRRLISRQSPFKADREHFHHLLARMDLSSRRVTGCIIVCAVMLAVTGLALHAFLVSAHVQFIAALGVFVGFVVASEVLRAWIRGVEQRAGKRSGGAAKSSRLSRAKHSLDGRVRPVARVAARKPLVSQRNLFG